MNRGFIKEYRRCSRRTIVWLHQIQLENQTTNVTICDKLCKTSADVNCVIKTLQNNTKITNLGIKNMSVKGLLFKQLRLQQLGLHIKHVHISNFNIHYDVFLYWLDHVSKVSKARSSFTQSSIPILSLDRYTTTTPLPVQFHGQIRTSVFSQFLVSEHIQDLHFDLDFPSESNLRCLFSSKFTNRLTIRINSNGLNIDENTFKGLESKECKISYLDIVESAPRSNYNFPRYFAKSFLANESVSVLKIFLYNIDADLFLTLFRAFYAHAHLKVLKFKIDSILKRELQSNNPAVYIDLRYTNLLYSNCFFKNTDAIIQNMSVYWLNNVSLYTKLIIIIYKRNPNQFYKIPRSVLDPYFQWYKSLDCYIIRKYFIVPTPETLSIFHKTKNSFIK